MTQLCLSEQGMRMHYYRFSAYDQAQNNWLLFTELNDPPWVEVKPRYRSYVCNRCANISYELVFREGFDAPMKIRAKGNLFFSTDGFFCIDEKAKLLIETAGFHGVIFKPILNTGWWVVSIELKVNADKQVYKYQNRCNECGRAKQTYDNFCCLTQIEMPTSNKSFFSPALQREGTPRTHQDVFVTEDIVTEFKRGGLKGGVFTRLLTTGEFDAVKAIKAERDPERWPKDAHVVL